MRNKFLEQQPGNRSTHAGTQQIDYNQKRCYKPRKVTRQLSKHKYITDRWKTNYLCKTISATSILIIHSSSATTTIIFFIGTRQYRFNEIYRFSPVVKFLSVVRERCGACAYVIHFRRIRIRYPMVISVCLIRTDRKGTAPRSIKEFFQPVRLNARHSPDKFIVR